MRIKPLVIALGLALFWFTNSAFLDGVVISKKVLTPQEKQEARQKIQAMSKETLKLLYTFVPSAKEEVANAYGYAVFSNLGINVLLISTENGSGLAHNNRTGEDVYMKMFSGGLGVGLGVKDFRIVFIFENASAYDHFVNSGWEANAQADAAAKYKEDGAAASAAVTVAPGMKLYKITQNGLALQATIQGTKYWKNDDLN
jgi:lipid-binding SYLF domain-containing protein